MFKMIEKKLKVNVVGNPTECYQLEYTVVLASRVSSECYFAFYETRRCVRIYVKYNIKVKKECFFF